MLTSSQFKCLATAQQLHRKQVESVISTGYSLYLEFSEQQIEKTNRLYQCNARIKINT